MRWWAGAWVIAGVVVVSACGTSAGGGGSTTGPSGSRSVEPSTGTPTPTFAAPSSPPPPPSPPPSSPAGTGPSGAARTPSASANACAAGHAEVTLAPGDAPERRLCVRPGTVVSLTLAPRTDDKRWVAVQSSAPVFVVASGWRVEGDGTARAALRCAGTRGGTAKVTALAKAPDVAGAAKVAFTLEVSVVPYTTER